jgi:hypothetical protein
MTKPQKEILLTLLNREIEHLESVMARTRGTHALEMFNKDLDELKDIKKELEHGNT